MAAFLLIAVGLISATAAAVPVEGAKLTADDAAASDLFGRSVAVDGDTAIAGAHEDDDGGANSGSAYVFIRSGTAWHQQAKLTASDAAAGDNFGISVGLEGDTAVIGAQGDDDSGSRSGSAYVFTRTNTTWSQQAKLTASDAAAGDLFGWSAALDGDTAVVGARWDDGPGFASGSAYVFTRSGTAWTEQAKLKALDAAALDQFGQPVAVHGDTALIGARLNDDAGSQSGSAYVFSRTNTTWTQQAKLTAGDAAAGDFFGGAVALDGDTAVVGAFLNDDNGTDSGSAYVFTRNANSWTEQEKLTADDAAAGDWFGFSVAVHGDTAVVGAWRDDDAQFSSGSAYVLTRTGLDWTQQDKLTASDAAWNDDFGFSVALDGSTAVVGAPQNDDDGTNSGSAYVFDLNPDAEGPVTSDTEALPNPVAVGTAATITALVDDATTGGSTIASAEYSIDGSPYEPLAATDGAYDEVAENVTGSVGPFAEAGIHEVCVRGTDAAGNMGPAKCTTLAVYDPDAGFVTGGGWITSPSGAYTPDDLDDIDHTGKATFGFVSKYKKGASVPTGSMEFQFPAADLKFKSTDYDWLVVTGPWATVRGEGTVNGNGSYQFTATVGNGDPDTLHMRIWDKATGDAFYDNGANTPLGSGSIAIHAK